MIEELGIAGRLLQAVGKMNGLTFDLLSNDVPPATDTPDARFAATLKVVQADTARTDAPCSRRTEDGHWLGGVAVPVDGRMRLLYAHWAGCDGSGPDPLEAPALDLLQCIQALLKEHKTSTIESQELVEELNKTYEDLHLFARIATQIRSLHYSEKMLRGLLQEMREAMRVELVAAVLDEVETVDVAVTSPDLARLLPDPRAFLAALIDEMSRSAPVFERNCFIVNCSSELPAFAAMHPQPFRALALVIQNGDRRYGWLTLVSFRVKEVFRRGEYRLLSTLVEQLALVLANTDLYRDLELFVINLVKSLVTAIEAKDTYTKGHSERVSQLCMRMGETMRLDSEQCRVLRWASVLHDVGKIGTPEAILNKPGRLSDREYDNIKEHPGKGAEILKSISQVTDTLPAIRHHHERYDGKGYPDGLAGEDIPLLARIIAVADTYDAITSTRAYRSGRSHADAVRIIHECSGTQFDPIAVKAFASTCDQGFRTSDGPEDKPPPDAVPDGLSHQQEVKS